MKPPLFFAFCVTYATSVAAQAAGTGYIAGLHPYQRPDGAPQLTEAVRAPEQLERMLHGVEKPVPGNVESIAVTGNWWVPLRQAGMNGAYDLRGWHDTVVETVSTSIPPVATSSKR